jgi:Uma2 family endonuclease
MTNRGGVVTAVPHLLTLQEYLQLGETEERTELVEGRIIVAASPSQKHGETIGGLYWQLRQQLPRELIAVPDTDIDMEFAPPDKPGSSRRPDLYVLPRSARDRVRREGGLARASELLVVVEIVSPSSRRTDRVIKVDEYARAGIPHYWIIDIAEPVSMLVCHQAGPFGYRDSGEITGKYEISEPFNAVIDLDQLLDD